MSQTQGKITLLAAVAILPLVKKYHVKKRDPRISIFFIGVSTNHVKTYVFSYASQPTNHVQLRNRLGLGPKLVFLTGGEGV